MNTNVLWVRGKQSTSKKRKDLLDANTGRERKRHRSFSRESSKGRLTRRPTEWGPGSWRLPEVKFLKDGSSHQIVIPSSLACLNSGIVCPR